MVDDENFEVFIEASGADPLYRAWTQGCRKIYISGTRAPRRFRFSITGCAGRHEMNGDGHDCQTSILDFTVCFSGKRIVLVLVYSSYTLYR